MRSKATFAVMTAFLMLLLPCLASTCEIACTQGSLGSTCHSAGTCDMQAKAKLASTVQAANGTCSHLGCDQSATSAAEAEQNLIQVASAQALAAHAHAISPFDPVITESPSIPPLQLPLSVASLHTPLRV